MSRFLIERLRPLEEYVPGEQPRDKKYVKLNTNESPYPPSPSVIAAINAESAADLRLYSDPTGLRLKKALAGYYGVGAENVFVCNGSDEALSFFFAAFCGTDVPINCPEISYGFYPVFAQYYGTPYNAVPMEDDLSVDHRRFLGVKGHIMIANPNAPTGIALSPDEIKEILESDPDRLVCVDEAYVDFGAQTALPLLADHPNLVVVRTYSKSRSMAGARLGFAFAAPEIIADLEKIKYSTNPYNVNRLTQSAGEAALLDGEYYRENCRAIIRDREFTVSELKKLGGVLTPSTANFIFVRFPGKDGGEIYHALKERGVLVRHFGLERIKDYLRITIGTREECAVLIAELKNILGGKNE
ncbi:MAG: histidinol-phosphate transaminase [Clostridia bacterium]|nr:histidinol-phosphate transaminase [Clostridia bacterium]